MLTRKSARVVLQCLESILSKHKSNIVKHRVAKVKTSLDFVVYLYGEYDVSKRLRCVKRIIENDIIITYNNMFLYHA